MVDKTKMFEQAARMKLRFNYKGSLTVEDLWDLKLEVLDQLCIEMEKALETSDAGRSRLERRSTKNDELALKVAIADHIIATRVAEKNAREDEKANAELIKKYQAILADKQDEAIRGKSPEELQAMIAALKK